MNNTNLSTVRGDTFPFDIRVINTSTGEPENLTGGSLTMTAKWSYTQEPTDDDITGYVFQVSSPSSGIVFISPSAGTANVTIPSSATAGLPFNEVNLVYDIQFIDAALNRFTVMRGILNVVPPVTDIE